MEMMKFQETLHKVHVHLSIRDKVRGWLEREAGLIMLELIYSTKPLEGHLTLVIHSAQLTRDTDLVGKIDPYVVIMYAGKEYKTKILKEAGLNPTWNESFQLPVSSINERM